MGVLLYIKYPDEVNIFCEVKRQETDNTDASGSVSNTGLLGSTGVISEIQFVCAGWIL